MGGGGNNAGKYGHLSDSQRFFCQFECKKTTKCRNEGK